MRRSKRRELYWDGLRDGLVTGLVNPHQTNPVYMHGFRDAERMIDRIVHLANNGQPVLMREPGSRKLHRTVT